MIDPQHLPDLPVCPYLPKVESPLRASIMKTCGKDRGSDFYRLALQCAQSLWLQGLPAQALLLINRAFGSELPGEHDPLPYAAAAWIMKNRSEQQFIGNPRRHYQHLATRMVEPRKELRSWRAWACWYLACRIFPDYPADEEQLKSESIVEPSHQTIYSQLRSLGLRDECVLWDSTAKEL